jgi:hypothetical protein
MAMNAHVATKTDDILIRSFALRFSIDTPNEAIQSVKARWNSVLESRFPGKIYFPDETDVEVLDKKLVKVVYIHADSEGWAAYAKRAVSIRPVVDAAIAAEGKVTPVSVPYLGRPAPSMP